MVRQRRCSGARLSAISTSDRPQRLGNLGELRHVAAAATTQPVKQLLDAYHLHRGGSAYEDIASIDGQSIDVFHLNDFPIERPIDELTDADRVYPGEGGGPAREIIALLAAKTTPSPYCSSLVGGRHRCSPGGAAVPVRSMPSLTGWPSRCRSNCSNRALWELPAAQVAATALNKMRSTVDLALA